MSDDEDPDALGDELEDFIEERWDDPAFREAYLRIQAQGWRGLEAHEGGGNGE